MNLTEVCGLSLPNTRPFRVGRGQASGNGKTAGRGLKGESSRSGHGGRILFIGGQLPLFRRMPTRGFSNDGFRQDFVVVNLEQIEGCKKILSGAVVDAKLFEETGLVNAFAADRHRLSEVDSSKAIKLRGKTQIRVLGHGKLTKAITVHAHSASESAVKKIEAAGGKFVLIPGPNPPVRNKTKFKKPSVPTVSVATGKIS